MDNWVEYRAQCDLMLTSGAGTVWDEVRAALQDACASYNEHYSPQPGIAEVTSKLENGRRMLISRKVYVTEAGRSQEVVCKLLVEFDELHYSVTYTRENPDATGQLRIDADKASAFIRDANGQRSSPDEASRFLLEPILFRGGEIRHVR